MAKTRSTLRRTPSIPQPRRGTGGGAHGSHGNTHGLEHPVASARWLLGALLGTLLLAAISVYGALCLLFWQGQWQIVFHPSRTVPTTPAAAGLKYDDIRFGATETGVLELAGWWIPADAAARYAGGTLFFLRDGSGSLSNSVDQLKVLHELGINVFAFDYRGFGASAKTHPSEEHTYEDADSAWRYLTETRHIAPGSIAIYGEKLGGVVAVETALRHPQTAGVILEDLPPPTLNLLDQNPRLHWLPVRLLFHDRYDPAKGLARLATPKLLLESEGSGSVSRYYARAAEPKTYASIGDGQPLYLDKDYLPALRQFLSAHLPAGPRS
jgi:pimeloyl-ACP methyl ester carboxylesterase